ncbi:hypothetical protein E4T44_12432, partial [Aureobasidium sp. EXF-8845]
MRYTTLSANKSEGVRWYWRTAAICASCLILGGFLVVPSIFDAEPQLRISKTVLGGFGVALLALGFSLAALTCFCSRSWAFSAEHVFIPCIFACLIGFLNVPYCFIISTRFQWNVIAMVTTIGAATTAFIFTVLYFFLLQASTSLQPATVFGHIRFLSEKQDHSLLSIIIISILIFAKLLPSFAYFFQPQHNRPPKPNTPLDARRILSTSTEECFTGQIELCIVRPETDYAQWYWRTAAICASCLILGGFLVVPSIFDAEPQLRISKTVLGGFGVALLALGFSLAALACFCSRSWAFSAEH